MISVLLVMIASSQTPATATQAIRAYNECVLYRSDALARSGEDARTVVEVAFYKCDELRAAAYAAAQYMSNSAIPIDHQYYREGLFKRALDRVVSRRAAN